MVGIYVASISRSNSFTSLMWDALFGEATIIKACKLAVD